MGKLKRGNYLFITWKGDHDPKHVHVYRNGKEILKWNLENQAIIRGKLTRKIKQIIHDLVEEGKL